MIDEGSGGSTERTQRDVLKAAANTAVELDDGSVVMLRIPLLYNNKWDGAKSHAVFFVGIQHVYSYIQQ